MNLQSNVHSNPARESAKFEHNVVSAIETMCKSQPDKTALVSEDRELTYRQLNEQADALTARIRKHGILPGQVVAVCIRQSTERIVAFLAAMKAGAAYLPVDGQLPENRIKTMLQDSGTALIIADERYMSRFDGQNLTVINVDREKIDKVANYEAMTLSEQIEPLQMAYIIYTSGSTGVPKGAAIHHAGFYHFVKAFSERWGFSSADRTLQFSSPSFDVTIIDIWVPLFNGSTIFLYPDNKIVGRPLLNYIVEHDIDVVPYLPPAVLSTLPANLPIGKLHTLSIAGEVPSEQAIRNWNKRVRLINVYGPTETTVCVLSHLFEEDTNPHVIGKPHPGADIYILDANMQKVATGTTGEIYIGGIQLSLGYINRPEETRQVFVDAPKWIKAEQGEDYKLYKSGDRAFWRPDGSIEFVGRMDDQVKIRGFRIELKEIEHHISQLPQVAHAAVKVHRPEEGLPVLAAFVQLKEQDRSSVNSEDIRTRLKQSLPNYMIPDRIIILEKLPLSHTGKIDKSQLNIPNVPVQRKTKEYLDSGGLKQEIKEIWCSLLNLENIRDEDDFFELGGHSLMLAQFHERLPQNVQKRISLPELYSYPSLDSFVREVEQRLDQNLVSQQEKVRQVEALLLKDAELPFDFEINVQPDPQILANPKHIFLTGVTGFVGSHLLEELMAKNPGATVHCLVRADDEASGLERIKRTFSKFKLVWNPEFESRMVIVTGDLTKAKLGIERKTYDNLLETIDVIYHMGSDVSYVQPYEHIKKPNVDGMSHILHLAVHRKVKFLIISSSMGVYSWGRSFTGKTWMTEDDAIEQNLPAVCRDMGYIRSKWVMDSMAAKARDKGLPVINFRLGFVVCHSKTGATPLNQWWSSLMRSCIELKAFPLVMGLKDEVVTVDYVCKTIAHISKKPEALGLNFNLAPLPEHDLALTDFCVRISEYSGLEMKGLDFHDWFEQWRRNQNVPIFALLYLFNEDVHEGKSLVESYQHTYYFKSDNTLRLLADSDIRPAVFDKPVMEAYLRYMKMI